MTAYSVGYATPRVADDFARYLARIDRTTATRIRDAVEALTDAPRPPGKKFKFLKPPVAVFQFVAQYRLRVGDHRILYDVDDAARRVVLLAIRLRGERTYRGA